MKLFPFLTSMLAAGGCGTPAPEPVAPEPEQAALGTEEAEPRPVPPPPPDLVEEPGCQATETCEGDLCWVQICGSTFTMGSDTGPEQTRPEHRVAVATFEMMKTEVTLGQYGRCVEAGACTWTPDPVPDDCVQSLPGPEERAMTCIDFDRARQVCTWAGGRLPSETQWEFAARSRGRNDRPYPWGEFPPNCDVAVLNVERACGKRGAWPVCSKPRGNTEQGLCDMAGNAFEWVEDWYLDDYGLHPVDGTAQTEEAGNGFRTMRGGGIRSTEPLTTLHRTFHEPHFAYSGMGVRCVR